MLDKANIYNTIILTQDLAVTQATASGNEFYEYTFSTYSYEAEDGYVTEILEIESGNIRQIIRGYPICAFITSPFGKYPLVHCNDQLQTVPYVLKSIHDEMVSTNQQIFSIKAHQIKQDNDIANFNTDQIKQVIENNNYLKGQVVSLQQQVV